MTLDPESGARLEVCKRIGPTAGCTNPTISAGTIVTVESCTWSGGTRLACVRVVEADDPDQVGRFAVVQVSNLRLIEGLTP